MKCFVIDLSICNGCYCCQIVCKDEHVDNDWTPYAKPQPDTGQFWMKIKETVRGTVPKVKVTYTPRLCLHCDKAPCIAACNEEGAIYKRNDGLVIIDPTKCTGCKLCIDACPLEAIYFNEQLNIAQKCTGCAHLLDNGWKVPRCVDACPTEAIKFGEESELKDLIDKAEPLDRGHEADSRVYYLNRPGKFVAGTVYDPAKKEVIIGARCVLKDIDSGEIFLVKTDNFGDFWFNDLKHDRKFSMTIERDGKAREMSLIRTIKDVNLGDIPLE